MDCIDFKKIFEESLDDYIQLLKIKSVYDIKNGTEITMTGSDGCVKFVANDVKFL